MTDSAAVVLIRSGTPPMVTVGTVSSNSERARTGAFGPVRSKKSATECAFTVTSRLPLPSGVTGATNWVLANTTSPVLADTTVPTEPPVTSTSDLSKPFTNSVNRNSACTSVVAAPIFSGSWMVSPGRVASNLTLRMTAASGPRLPCRSTAAPARAPTVTSPPPSGVTVAVHFVPATAAAKPESSPFSTVRSLARKSVTGSSNVNDAVSGAVLVIRGGTPPISSSGASPS